MLRDGEVQDISIFDLLVGDVLLFETGDILPADAVIFTGHGIRYAALSSASLPLPIAITMTFATIAVLIIIATTPGLMSFTVVIIIMLLLYCMCELDRSSSFVSSQSISLNVDAEQGGVGGNKDHCACRVYTVERQSCSVHKKDTARHASSKF